MKNKIIMLFISIFSTFFFVSSVSANTYNYNVPSYISDLTDADLQTMKDLANANGLGGANYIIWTSTNTSPKFQMFSFSRLSFTSDYKLDYGNCRLWKFSDDLTTLTGYGYNCPSTGTKSILPGEVINNVSTTYILYINNNYPLNYLNNNDTFNYIFPRKTYSYPSFNDLKFYPIFTMLEDYHSDPYKTLTDFVTLTIDRLNFTTNYFTSNYIYLSMFVIFFIYFSILLVRRLL